MTVKDIQYHPLLPWPEYLSLPATSFSSLKEYTSPPAGQGIKLGALVHQYLLKPKEYNYEMYDIVRPIAAKLVEYVGPTLIKQMVGECPVTATFCVDAFKLPWKGVPDLHIANIVVVDFKIINSTLKQYVQWANSDNQIRGYMLPTAAPLGLLIGYNKRAKQVEVEPVKQDTRWWEQVVISRGQL